MTFFNTSVTTKTGFCLFDVYASRSARVRYNGAMWSIVDRRGWQPKLVRGLTAQGVRDWLAANA